MQFLGFFSAALWELPAKPYPENGMSVSVPEER